MAGGAEPDTPLAEGSAASLDPEIGADVNLWISIVKRAKLPAGVKLVAHTLASYADRDGTSIFPGVARLAADCSLGYSSVQRHLKQLRDSGLIENTRRANRRAGKSDVYRLVLAPDLLEHCEISDPEEHRRAIDALARRKRSRGAPRPRITPQQRGVIAAEVEDDHASPVRRDTGFRPHQEQQSGLTGEAPPSIDPPREDHPPSQTLAGVCDGRTGSAPGGAENQNGNRHLQLVNGHWRDPLEEARRQAAEARAARGGER